MYITRAWTFFLIALFPVSLVVIASSAAAGNLKYRQVVASCILLNILVQIWKIGLNCWGFDSEWVARQTAGRLACLGRPKWCSIFVRFLSDFALPVLTILGLSSEFFFSRVLKRL